MSEVRFLMLHDDEETIETVQSVLRDKNTDVVEARNGENYLELVRSGNFNVVMIDITMPTINGVEVLQEIVNTGLPEWIIVFTNEQTKSLATGEVGTEQCVYQKKPIDSDEFTVLIDNILLDV